jgi:alpha-1,3-glucosyltransferase
MASSLLSRGISEPSEQPVLSSAFPFPPRAGAPAEPRSLTPVLAACRHPGVVLLTALLIRCAVGLGAHSGMSTPPLYGDYEAQRHWMEITTSLPMKEWYFNTTDNDLAYWGLDYPPLTAYVSWLCGRVALILEPEMVALHTSRGIETQSSKSFMRLTVLFCDVFVMIPAVWLVCVGLYRRTRTSARELLSLGKAPREMPTSRRYRVQAAATSHAYGLEAAAFSMEVVLLVLLQPGFVLIDHGHFQYNCVALGLSAWAVLCVMQGQLLVASVAYSLSLNFKHMSLYYAPAFFFFLLSNCFGRRTTTSSTPTTALTKQVSQQQQAQAAPRFTTVLYRIANLGVVVIITFALMWGPLCVAGAPFLTPSCLTTLPGGRRSTWCAIEQCSVSAVDVCVCLS